MSRVKIILIVFCIMVLFPNSRSQKLRYSMPEAVSIELNRLEEAYRILDLYSESVWSSWDDYRNFPFLFTFQNGLRVLTGHPAPPPVFVPYPDLTVGGSAVYIDTTNLNDFIVRLPLQCGGGPIPLGYYDNKQVTVVDIRCLAPSSLQQTEYQGLTGEDHILTFIHELMHCHQPQILKYQYGNLRINPDLNMALYAEIEGQALEKAYEKDSYAEAAPFLRDFCIARSIKVKDLFRAEKNSLANDEFREGEAVYAEVKILEDIGNGFSGAAASKNDTAYRKFAHCEAYISRYPGNLARSSRKTLEVYQKNYWYGCFQALLLQRYFPGWQKEIEGGKWLDQVLRERLDITSQDSLNSLRRFKEVYDIDNLKARHGKVISERNDTYWILENRKGMTYIIDAKPVSQFLSSLVDTSVKSYELGLMNMFPEGPGELKFDKVSILFRTVPSEINQLYYIKAMDVNPQKTGRPYEIQYESKDGNGYYYNVMVETPLFTLKAPKISIIESTKRVKFIIHSRV